MPGNPNAQCPTSVGPGWVASSVELCTFMCKKFIAFIFWNIYTSIYTRSNLYHNWNGKDLCPNISQSRTLHYIIFHRAEIEKHLFDRESHILWERVFMMAVSEMSRGVPLFLELQLIHSMLGQQVKLTGTTVLVVKGFQVIWDYISSNWIIIIAATCTQAPTTATSTTTTTTQLACASKNTQI